MPLVNAKCTNCGAPLQVDNTHEAAVCQYCGSAFIVEKAIQNYNYHITNNITAQNVIVAGKGEMEKERLLQNAKTQMEFKEYNKAMEIFKQVAEDYPDDYRGWYGMATIITEDFQDIKLNQNNFQEVESYINKALISVQGHNDTEIREKWNNYCQRRDQFISANVNELSDLSAKHGQMVKELNSLRQQRNALAEEGKSVTFKMQKNERIGLLLTVWCILGAFFFFSCLFILLYNDYSFQAKDTPYYIGLIILPVSILIYKRIVFSTNKNKKKIIDSQIQELDSQIQTANQTSASLSSRISEIKEKYKI